MVFGLRSNLHVCSRTALCVHGRRLEAGQAGSPLAPPDLSGFTTHALRERSSFAVVRHYTGTQAFQQPPLAGVSDRDRDPRPDAYPAGNPESTTGRRRPEHYGSFDNTASNPNTFLTEHPRRG